MIGDREFTTAGRIVGDGHPILVVAEVGANHDGDVGTAHEMIDMVADCGADLAERLGLRLHLAMCAGCTGFDRQVLTMHNVMKQWRNYAGEEPESGR